MGKITRRCTLLFAVVLAVVWLSGCGSKTDEEGQAAEGNHQTGDAETQTAVPGENGGDGAKPEAPAFDYDQQTEIMFYNTIVSASYFDDYILPHLNKKFPNVKVTHAEPSSAGGLDALIAAKTVPDIALTATNGIVSYIERDIFADILPLAKSNNLDLSGFQDNMLGSVLEFSQNGELFALPWTYGTTALFYNKEIFDQFGVDYPEDGMRWDSLELLDRVRKLNRPQEGIHGIMFNLDILVRANQLSQPMVDAKSEKAAVQSEGWKTLFTTFHDLYITGGGGETAQFSITGVDSFTKHRNVALWAGSAAYPALIDMEKKGEGFDWDIVSLPTFREAEGFATQYDGALFGISAANGKQDLALHMIHLLTSADVQKQGGSLLRFPTLKDSEVRDAFGKGEPIVESRNMKALLHNAIPPSPPRTKYDRGANSIMIAKAGEVLNGQKDVNTALREAAEEIDIHIASLKKSD